MRKMFSKMNDKLIHSKQNNRYNAEFNSFNDSQNMLINSFHQDDKASQVQRKYVISPSPSNSSN